MPLQMAAFMQAFIEDLWGTDPLFFYEMADVVATLAIDDNLLTRGQANRTLICILSCKAFASCPVSQRMSRMVSSWNRLNVLEKRALKQAVRIPRPSLRNRTLLKLAGVEERAQPIPGTLDVGNHVSRAKHVRFHVHDRADANATKSSNKARGATPTRRVAL
eukprot:CAMPEP_0194551336 /NCGR_PEP_ID=MMETSP0253-20130528/96170_1 /TAXON_ID=2966 /ORGANISM="Noctiluca scintillans" /LENGTH=161 /DNA_ID=CAMNT_0039398793 /DNA_START=28 /DNA_END=513 /DNA_ORIENTATION=-